MQDPLMPQPPLPDETMPLAAVHVSTRRKFLQTAVIAAAGATAVGATGIAAATPQHPKVWHAIQTFCGYHPPLSGLDPATLSFENTSYVPVSSFSVKPSDGGDTNSPNVSSKPSSNSHPEFFLWFTHHALPAGDYTLSYVVVNVKEFSPNSSTYTPFGLADSTKNAKNAFLFLSPPLQAPDIPDHSYAAKTPKVAAFALDPFTHNGVTSTAINTIHNDSTQDVQVMLHLRFTGTFKSDKTKATYQFQGILKNKATHKITYTHGLTVTANKGDD